MLTAMHENDAVILQLETYYDAVPRARSNVESVGPFTLFVATSGWPYYARPAIEGSIEITSEDVRRVLDRQVELGVPQSLEWVDQITPGLAETVESMGIAVERCPLLVLDGPPRGEPGSARIIGSDESSALVESRAAVSVAFQNAGTATGTASLAERDAQLQAARAEVETAVLARLAAEELRVAAVFVPGEPDVGAVGGGSYAPVAGVAEIAGVGVLPAFRRRGLAAAITHALAADALSRGVTRVFCSAEDDDVARVYAGIGFTRVGTACIARVEPAAGE